MKCKDKYKNELFLNKLDFVLISQKSESIFLHFFFKCWILRKKKDFEMKQILNFFKYLYKNFYENN